MMSNYMQDMYQFLLDTKLQFNAGHISVHIKDIFRSSLCSTTLQTLKMRRLEISVSKICQMRYSQVSKEGYIFGSSTYNLFEQDNSAKYAPDIYQKVGPRCLGDPEGKVAFIYDVRCFLGISDLPTYPNQILYYISLCSKIRCSLTYLPT